MDSSLTVSVVTTGASEGNTPLETIANTDAEDIEFDVVVWGEAESAPYDLDVTALNARSRIDFNGYIDLFDHLLSTQPDVIHVHPISIGTITSLFARIAGIPVVSTEHNPCSEYEFVKRVVNGIKVSLSTVSVSNSRSTRDAFTDIEKRAFGIFQATLDVIPYGPDIPRIDEAQCADCPVSITGDVTIVTGGRLVQQKNLGVLIQAFSEVLELHPDAELIITGEGPEQNKLKQQTEDLDIRNSVRFVGWLPKQEHVFALYKCADVFAFPSHYEGFGMANAEAMATGTPVVVNDIPVLQEVVGEAGLTVDATDESELADALCRLIEDEDLRDRLGQAARRRIKDNYSIQRAADDYADVYRRVAGAHCSSDRREDGSD